MVKREYSKSPPGYRYRSFWIQVRRFTSSYDDYSKTSPEYGYRLFWIYIYMAALELAVHNVELEKVA